MSYMLLANRDKFWEYIEKKSGEDLGHIKKQIFKDIIANKLKFSQ